MTSVCLFTKRQHGCAPSPSHSLTPSTYTPTIQRSHLSDASESWRNCEFQSIMVSVCSPPPPPPLAFLSTKPLHPSNPILFFSPLFHLSNPQWGGGPLAFLLLCPGGMQHYPLVMSQLHEHTHMWQERGSVWDRGYLRASQSHMLPLLLGVKLLCSQKEPSDYFTQEHCVKVCVTVSIQVYLFICTVLDIC